ncbi:AAA family ATPase [Subtercola endophyticus]|uniref:AAA family ATPase n=1 Tax=Subtercola endophyticus TaxID=2895559 RepID=UPI001E354375|nr:AAA family ATPase [Subtercola endophyticus]UFS58713.1 AAA family ATPase [Subtercola endophyticus]
MTVDELFESPSRKFVVFEGYDGSGKSTLINALVSSEATGSVRVVGRKKESELVEIAKVLERDDLRPDPRAEMLLRIAVEVERLNIISRSLLTHDVVVCDRGPISMIAWFRYLEVPSKAYEGLLEELWSFYRDSVTVVCRADFATCWQRSSGRLGQSRKDRLGEDANRRFFDQYQETVTSSGASIALIDIDTVNADVSTSLDEVLEAMRSNGITS